MAELKEIHTTAERIARAEQIEIEIEIDLDLDLDLDLSDLNSGVYFYECELDAQKFNGKIILVN